MTIQEQEAFMAEAIKEGQKAIPKCFPNPPVGCVIVKDNEIIARGHTNEPGKPHAEIMALNNLPKGVEEYVMFVTLEPCSFHGRTPSCARTITGTSCKAVYVGMIDPHEKNNGKGMEILEASGIGVQVGILEEEVSRQLSPYLLQH
ncbi:MAG: bifunctional diaminohydroxyphosphoribosylaminopyrimidine deaminase/5-amino-6-(5-phosphoribosylamino)uracil reductase RibD [Bacteroidota bacterium]